MVLSPEGRPVSRSSPWILLTAAAAVAGCTASVGESGGGGGIIPAVNRFTELANSLEDAAESELPTLTLTTPGLPPSFPATAGCPLVSNVTDADGDGILDNATYSFTDPPCSAGFGGGTWAVTGLVGVQDSSLTGSDGYTLTLTDLALQFTDTGGTLTYTATRNGTRSRGGDASTVTLAVTDTVKRARPQITAVATIAKDLVWTFTAATAGTITVDQELPSGTVTVDGTLHWRRSTEDWTLTVATVTPLEYDATCTTTPRRIKSGTVTMTGEIGGVAGVLTIDWNGCDSLPTRVWTTS
jgi:hypothetical protein